MDTSEYVRFQRPGHGVTGDRSSQDRRHRDSVDNVHATVDDHSRLAYAEVHPDQKAATAAGFLERALGFFAEHGIVAKRLITDNAWIHVKGRDLRRLLDRTEIRHLKTKPCRLRTNGKVERFHQMKAREWAYASSTRLTANAPQPCHTGSTTTTRRDRTAHPEGDPRSVAFTTSVGRTARGLIWK